MLLPEINLWGLDSFWIGSLLVSHDHWPLHDRRRHERRGVYRSHADSRLDHRIGAGNLFRPARARRMVGTASHCSFGHVQSVEADGSGGPARAPGLRSRMRTRWRGTSTTIIRGLGCSSARPSSVSGTGARISISFSERLPRPTRPKRAADPSRRRFSNFSPCSSLSFPASSAMRWRLQKKCPASNSLLIGPDGNIIRDNAQQAFPLMVAHVLPVGDSRHRGRRPACGTHEFSGRRIQCQRHSVHDRFLWHGCAAACRRNGWYGWAESPPPSWFLIGICWIPVIRGGRGLYDYLQGMQAISRRPSLSSSSWGFSIRE